MISKDLVHPVLIAVCWSALALCAQASMAMQQNTEHTYKLGNSKSPPASIEDVAWLAGSWIGTAFDSNMEENWNSPSANSMVGFFKLYDDDGVNFYELLLLVEEESSLVMKVKHFTADFTAWEEKDKYISFPLVKIEENAIHFSGLSFYRTSENEMTGYIALTHADGSVSEEELIYNRR